MDSVKHRCKSPANGDIHYNVAPAGAFGGPILDVVLPDGTRIRRIDEGLHLRALEKANETLATISENWK